VPSRSRGDKAILQVPLHVPKPPRRVGRPGARANLTPVTTTYIECPQCGKRALAVATRCPHCGFHFPPRPLNRPSDAPSLGPTGTALAVGGAVLAIILVAVLIHRGPAGSVGVPAAVPQADAAPAARAATPGPAPAPATVVDSVASPPATAPVPARPPTEPSGRRYAQTWVNVRGERTRSAPPVAMLNPGDAVMVDSLVRGWYRVLVDGRALGYVHRSTLDVTRPE
jgi:Bacterial SH3 domain